MNFDLSEEQEMLREQVGRLFTRECPASLLRSTVDDGAQYNLPLWNSLSELGVLGAVIPEDLGGVGLTELDLCVVLEQAGRVLAPIPLYSSICLGAEIILALGSEAQQEHWLPKLASGEKRAALAYPQGMGVLATRDSAVNLKSGLLSGKTGPCGDADSADIIVVTVPQNDGWQLCLVEASHPGITVEALQGFDQLRQHSRIEFKDVAVEPLGNPVGAKTLEILECRTAVYVAFEQIGGAQACLEMALAYTKERPIFSRPLASYQSTKHKLADVFVAIELARSNAYYAAWAMEAGSDDLVAACAAARISATQAFELASRENQQLHGGIGYTWEADCHFYYRRSRLLALNCGSQEIWQDRLISALAKTASGD